MDIKKDTKKYKPFSGNAAESLKSFLDAYDGNLASTCKKIGKSRSYGYRVARDPKVWDEMKKKNIAIFGCPEGVKVNKFGKPTKVGVPRRKKDDNGIVTFLEANVDITRALDLRIKKGLSYNEIGRRMGVSGESVRTKLIRFEKLMSNGEDIVAFRALKSDILDGVELSLLNDLMDEEKRKGASLNNIAYAVKNVYDMNRLEKGQSTANISYADLTKSLEEIQMERKQLAEQLGISTG